MTVFAAFMSTWSSARQTFGEGEPQSGAAANAYTAANTEHGRVISELADLDQLLGAQVDDSARTVSALPYP